MDESTFQFAKSTGLLLTVATLLLLQWWLPWGRFAREDGRWYRNLPLALINALVFGAICGACVCAASRAGQEWGGFFSRYAIPPLAAMAGTVLLMDAVSWAWHRANHLFPVLWRFHAVHHSDRVFDFTTALRFHGGELLLSLPLRLALAFLLAAPVEALLVFEILFQFFNLFEHGNIRLPARFESTLSAVFVVPALHRIHHSRKRAELDSNFGTIFSVWDRLFRTFHDGRSTDAVKIGLPSVPAPQGVLPMLVMPFRRAEERAS